MTDYEQEILQEAKASSRTIQDSVLADFTENGKVLTSTRGGKFVDLLNLNLEDINFRDIFTTLSKKGRFNDVSDNKISVLQHSHLVKEIVLRRNHFGLDQKAIAKRVLAALIHDSAEAFIGDIITTVKKSPYVRIGQLEDAINLAIFQAAFEDKFMELRTVRNLLNDLGSADKIALSLEVPRAFKYVDQQWYSSEHPIFTPAELSVLPYLKEFPVDKILSLSKKDLVDISLFDVAQLQRTIKGVSTDSLQFLSRKETR